MGAIQSLDVTKIEPKLKHPTIFKYFDELEPGQSFIIKNDHDPKPLYYELIGERGNVFTWKYIEKGPEWFIVEIAKNLNNVADEDTVGGIVAQDIRKAEILKAKGIDFSCGGNKTLKQAGEEVGVSEEELRIVLNSLENTSVSPSVDYNKWELGFLIDYIVNTHHLYIKDNAAGIKELAVKVAQHHGENHPELNRLANSVGYFIDGLLNHITKEERILFPAIKNEISRKNGTPITEEFDSDFIKKSIQLMQKEHGIAGEDLTFFRKITDNYTLPEDACNSYRYLFEKLKEFENDLHIHIHLENNILFPKSLKLVTE